VTPIPEPAGDIRAQLAAVMDPAHPKQACFVVPADHGQIPYVLNAFIETRPEGTLITTDVKSADWFKIMPNHQVVFDEGMATILGYPQSKPDVVANCGGAPIALARAVQALDADGYVVTEAFCSPVGLRETSAVLSRHVPPGGWLAVLTPVEAIGRRLLLREAEK
jgi:hypothetical protein